MPQPHRRLLLLALLTCALLVATGAFAQRVVINGAPLVTSLSPVTMGGSMLLPMRDVFVALGAEIKWFAAEQKIMAVRGFTTIELWIGRPLATLNGQAMNLPIAPTLIGGSTYVPLRFPAEAFGGTVKWDGPTATAFIDIPETNAGTLPANPATPPTDPATPPTGTVLDPLNPANPATPQANNVEGTVIQIVPNPAGVVLSTGGDVAGLVALSLDAATVITRSATDAAPKPATLASVRVGDFAQATIARGNVAATLALSYGTATGKVLAIANNTLFLDSGVAYELSNQARFLNNSGGTIPLNSISAGSTARITYEPRSKLVWEVKLTNQAATTNTASGKPQIQTVGLLNNKAYFRKGDTMDVQLTGTPGGQALVTLGKLVSNLPVPEVEAGTYRTRFTVPGVADQTGMLISANLNVGGIAADLVRAQARFGIDNTGPVVAGTLPANGAAINNVSPTIQVLLGDSKGAPTDLRSASMVVNGRDVSADLGVSEDDLTYFAPELPGGVVNVSAAIRDVAGNVRQVNWNFTINANNTGALQAVSHDARGVLLGGDTVTVNATVLRPGGVASFSLGGLVRNVSMQRLAASNRYRGTYTVRNGDTLTDGLVTVTYRDPQGVQGTLDAVSRLNINSGLTSNLTITSPLDQSQVGDVIVASGTARPRSRVRVTITYTARLITNVTGQLWSDVLTASRDGLWTTPEIGSSVGFIGRANTYLVKAEALDAAGAVTGAREITLRK